MTTIVTNDETGYRCDDCGLHYADRDTAEQCEQFCQDHGACNTDIVTQSIESGPNRA